MHLQYPQEFHSSQHWLYSYSMTLNKIMKCISWNVVESHSPYLCSGRKKINDPWTKSFLIADVWDTTQLWLILVHIREGLEKWNFPSFLFSRHAAHQNIKCQKSSLSYCGTESEIIQLNTIPLEGSGRGVHLEEGGIYKKWRVFNTFELMFEWIQRK